MNLAVLSYNKVSNSSTLAHNKITLAIGELCPSAVLLDDEKQFSRNNDIVFDKIFIVNGMECFCDYRDNLIPFIEDNPEAKLYWCSNDYALAPSKKIREILSSREATIVSTVDKKLYKNPWFKDYRYVNFNILAYNPNFDYKLVEKSSDIVYFGAFREGRIKYFKKYFPFLNNMVVSTTDRNFDKFKEIAPNVLLTDKFDFVNSVSKNGLAKYKYSIYLEDEKSNEVYCSPANRFYECISNGVLMFFDSSCVETFRTAEIDIEKFVVSGPEEIKHKIESIERDFNRYEDFQRGWVSAVDLDLVKTNFRNVIFEGFEEDKKEIHQKQSFW